MLERLLRSLLEKILSFRFNIKLESHTHTWLVNTIMFHVTQNYYDNLEPTVVVDYELVCTSCKKSKNHRIKFNRKESERDPYSPSSIKQFDAKMMPIIKELINAKHCDVEFRKNDDLYC